jgi:hypothetical protein
MPASGKAFLQGEPNAPNTYDHMAAAVLKVLVESPGGIEKGLSFEHLSLKLKEIAASPTELSIDEKLAEYLRRIQPTEKQKLESVRLPRFNEDHWPLQLC